MIGLVRQVPQCAYEPCGRDVKTNGAGKIKSRWCAGHQKQAETGRPLRPLRARLANGRSMAEDSRVAMLGRRIEYLLQRMQHDGQQFPSDVRMERSGWERRLLAVRLEDEDFERQVDRLAATLDGGAA
jgi:hypothetical protein